MWNEETNSRCREKSDKEEFIMVNYWMLLLLLILKLKSPLVFEMLPYAIYYFDFYDLRKGKGLTAVFLRVIEILRLIWKMRYSCYLNLNSFRIGYFALLLEEFAVSSSFMFRSCFS